MALQSQSRRPLARTTDMYRRGRGRKRWPAALAAIVLTLAGLGLVKFWPHQTSTEAFAALRETAGDGAIREESRVARETPPGTPETVTIIKRQDVPDGHVRAGVWSWEAGRYVSLDDKVDSEQIRRLLVDRAKA